MAMMSTIDRNDSSYLTMALKVRELEVLKSKCESNKRANPAYLSAVESELKHAITLCDAAPRRTMREIAADLEKYRRERVTIANNRTPIIGPSMTVEEWISDVDDSTGFWVFSAEGRRLGELDKMIDVLMSEMDRLV